MKANISSLFALLFLVGVTFLSVPALAQSEGLSPTDSPDPNHLEYSPTEEKSAIIDHEAKARITRDSLIAHSRITAGSGPAKSKSPDGKSANEDDDALSFNFLYYIIQKFKISDIIDE